MSRLLHDRYLVHDGRHGWDLATGALVPLDRSNNEAASSRPPMPALVEALDYGIEGMPRGVETAVPPGSTAAALVQRAAADACARGYIPVDVTLYRRLGAAIAAEVQGRALLLIAQPGTPAARACAALVEAAARSSRPHLLLTIRGSAPAGGALRAREARAAYGAGRSPLAPPMPDVAAHVARAARAGQFVREGRHAAAERLLRDVLAALQRRQAHAPAARIGLELGRLLLVRGRVTDAERIFDDAAAAGTHPQTASEARIWQVHARIDAAQLTAAESLCRALLVGETTTGAWRAWAQASLARVLLWQGRVQEAVALHIEPVDPGTIDESTRAWILSVEVRLCLARDDLFGAGLRARALLARTEGPHEPPQGEACDSMLHPVSLSAPAMAREAAADVLTMRDRFVASGARRPPAAATPAAAHACSPLSACLAHSAHLRVLAATGDLTLAGDCLRRVLQLAREARMPLRSVGARLLWVDALRRAGRGRDADRVCSDLQRFRAAMPPLLRRAIEERVSRRGVSGAAVAAEARPAPPGTTFAALDRERSVAADLIVLAQADDQDAAAVRHVLERSAAWLRCSRLDLCSADAGPVSTIMSIGGGLATSLGTRVLEAGILIGPEDAAAGEIGAPVRLGARLVAALVARWPIDRTPPESARALLEIAAAVTAPRIDAMVASARETAQAATTIPELVGVSRAVEEVRAAVARAAAAPFNVHIEGESGVGKELVARAIHHLSRRRERRFCDVNCAAIPDDLLESELFGHARGAFTGAVAERVGLFEEAHGGTLFLDEVADLSARAQAKLLRAVQQQEIRRVGESFARPIDVRVVSAANRDLRGEAAAGRFRQDLLYRLDVIRIRIPPLRERPDDVPVLARHFWETAAARVGTSASLTHGVLAALARYHWPGNVRELQNVMAGLAVAAPARGRVTASIVPGVVSGATAVTATDLAEARTQFERRFIEAALARAGGSRSRAARELGLSRQGLLKMMGRLGLGRASEQEASGD